MKTLIFLLMLPFVVCAQEATFEASSESFVGLVTTCPVVIDINADNKSDLLLNGYDTVNNEVVSPFYTNDGFAHFTLDGMTVEEFVNGGAVAKDFDNDGDEDLFYTGFNVDGRVLNYLENLGDGSFNNKPCNNNLNLLGLSAVTVSTGDVDADGDLDIFLSGSDGTEEQAYLLINDGSGCFSVSTQEFDGAHGGGSVLADLDNNGYPDLVYFGTRNQQELTTVRLNVNGIFGTPISNTGLLLIYDGKIAADHLNDDQFMDLVFAATTSSGSQAKVCFGNGDGTFTCEQQDLPQARQGGVLIEDFDNDGDNDVFINGKLQDLDETRISKLYLNDGEGNFTDSGQFFIGIYGGKAVAIHANNDDYLDIFISGDAGVGFPLNEPTSKLYINTTALSVEEFNSDDIVLYPVPANDRLNIKVPNNIQIKLIEMYDMLGNKVLSQDSADPISVGVYASGIYVLNITDIHGVHLQKKVIIQ